MKKLSLWLFPLLTSLLLAGSATAHVALDFPVGGETFGVGDTVNIQWHVVVPHAQENWDLHFSPDGGANWEPIQLDMPVSQLSFLWIVPPVVTEQAQVRIVQDNTGTDYEDISGDFTIQDATTPEEIDDLAIAVENDNIHLWWTEPSDDVGVIRYVIYRNTVAHSLGDSVAGTTDTSYTDVNAAGTAGINYFYGIKAVDAAGNKSEGSNMVGEFDQSLSNGR